MPWRCFSDVSVMFFQTARSNKTQTSLRSCDITIYNKLTTDHICSKHATWSSPSQQSLAIREKQSQPEVCDGWDWILQLDVESDGRAEFGFKLNPFNWFFLACSHLYGTSFRVSCLKRPFVNLEMRLKHLNSRLNLRFYSIVHHSAAEFGCVSCSSSDCFQ